MCYSWNWLPGRSSHKSTHIQKFQKNDKKLTKKPGSFRVNLNYVNSKNIWSRKPTQSPVSNDTNSTVSFWPKAVSRTLFICPANNDFCTGLQIFLHAGCHFLHPAELAPHAKNDACVYWCLQIWSRILRNCHLLESLVQISIINSD